jgi:hypothetical protein
VLFHSLLSTFSASFSPSRLPPIQDSRRLPAARQGKAFGRFCVFYSNTMPAGWEQKMQFFSSFVKHGAWTHVFLRCGHLQVAARARG